MNSKQSEQRVALVTGASSGFGLVTARRLAALGYRVFGTNRSGQGNTPDVEMLALDVDTDSSVVACIAELMRRTGRLDVLVNNAGRALVGACEETSAAEARALFETNVFGVMRVSAAVLPIMRQQRSGTIVNVGSVSGFVGVPFHGVYAASKHALAGYTEALRHEVRGFGVQVCVVEPAAHKTGIQMARPQHLLSIYDQGRQTVEAIIRKQIDTGNSPERVADVIVAAVRKGAPRVRYRIGLKALLAVWGLRLLPMRLWELAVRREFRLAAAAPGGQRTSRAALPEVTSRQ